MRWGPAGLAVAWTVVAGMVVAGGAPAVAEPGPGPESGRPRPARMPVVTGPRSPAKVTVLGAIERAC